MILSDRYGFSLIYSLGGGRSGATGRRRPFLVLRAMGASVRAPPVLAEAPELSTVSEELAWLTTIDSSAAESSFSVTVATACIGRIAVSGVRGSRGGFCFFRVTELKSSFLTPANVVLTVPF